MYPEEEGDWRKKKKMNTFQHGKGDVGLRHTEWKIINFVLELYPRMLRKPRANNISKLTNLAELWEAQLKHPQALDGAPSPNSAHSVLKKTKQIEKKK